MKETYQYFPELICICVSGLAMLSIFTASRKTKMAFYQVFDSGRFCVLDLAGRGPQRSGKTPSLIYATMPAAAARTRRCVLAVTVSLLKATVVISH